MAQSAECLLPKTQIRGFNLRGHRQLVKILFIVEGDWIAEWYHIQLWTLVRCAMLWAVSSSFNVDKLFRTQAQHLCFLHDSIWLIWFDTIICLSNLSCELWNRKLKIKETFFKKRKKYYLKALKRLATVLERNNVGMGQDLNCVLLRKGSNVFTNCYTAFYWLTLIALQSQERKPYYYSAWSKLSFSLLYSQTVWRDWVIFLSSWHQIFL